MTIKDGETTISDTLDKIHKTKDGVVCCGGKAKIVMHIDGVDFYEYTYQCECGNTINVHSPRKEWW